MKKFGMFEAKTHFSSIIERVVAGETVVVTKNGVPVAKIVPIESDAQREFGVARELFASGAISVGDDFNAPLPAELLVKIHGK